MQPMLATAGPLPTGPGWAYEFKWDGVRTLADVGPGGLVLISRLGNEVTAAYPELAGISGVAVEQHVACLLYTSDAADEL